MLGRRFQQIGSLCEREQTEGFPHTFLHSRSVVPKVQIPGKPCRAAATTGGLCFFHANPIKAAELGRIGGRSRRSSLSETADPLPKLESAMAVRATVDRLVAEVYAGKIQPRWRRASPLC
jgi:hypothetical protein